MYGNGDNLSFSDDIYIKSKSGVFTYTFDINVPLIKIITGNNIGIININSKDEKENYSFLVQKNTNIYFPVDKRNGKYSLYLNGIKKEIDLNLSPVADFTIK